MTDIEIREAHDRLIGVYDKIRTEFSSLDKELLLGIYGEEHLSDVRKYGDGHTLWAVPSCAGKLIDILSDTELVLIVAKFPYLGDNSEFNPYENLTNIQYWCNKVKLRPKVDSTSEGSIQYHFWVWQNDCPVHGISVERACENRRRLLDENPRLCERMQKQNEVSGRLVTASWEWLRSQGRELKVFVHNSLKTEVHHAISQLKDSESVFYKRTDVFKAGNIMELLTKHEAG